MQTDVSMPDFSHLTNKIKDKKKLEKAINQTVADCKSRGPAQIAKAVREVYAIKSSDMTAAGQSAKKGAKSAGKVSFGGITIENVQLIYSGRLLTPTHFSMSPKSRPAPGKKYKVKAAVFKGAKKVLGSSVFLAPSGALGTTEIPFKRSTEKRLPIEAIRTVSIPQMITNQTVAPKIEVSMKELLAKRLEHNISRYVKD